ncbi:MAG TPA: hypothetical protein VFN88_13600 [Caulobacteraceae bacterium]|nr:hypothetical protein [Caulobacteraceae bacterium]
MTAALTGLCVIAAVFCGWRGARPPDPMKGPRMVPWQVLMLTFAAIALILLIKVADQLHLTGR